MNFLIVNHYAGTPGLGMELRPYYFAEELLKRGHKVSIVASSFSHHRFVQPVVSKNFSINYINNIQYFWLKTPSYKRNNIKRVYNIFIFLFKLYYYRNKISEIRKYDIIISSSTYPLDIFLSRWLSRKHKAKLIFEVHDLWPLSPMILGNYSKWNPFIILLQFAENFALRECDYVISLLENSQNYMVEHGLKPYKFNYLPNGVKLEEWQNVQANEDVPGYKQIIEYRKKFEFLVGYAGALGPANAMDIFINSANILKRHSIGFIIIGNGQDEDILMKKTEELNLKNVLFINRVKKEYLPNILGIFDILYLGYKDNSLYKYGICPNKLFDYMMAAKPIILSLGYNYSIIEKSGGGFIVKPDDPDSIAEIILKLYQMDHRQRLEIGEAGRNYVEKHHSYKVLTNQLLKIINEYQ